jgi:ATP-binding cassette subfamily G (WHITE) protein 2 (SNQ2)
MTTEGPETIEEVIQEQPPRTPSIDSKGSEASGTTLAAYDGSFDFAKTLRDIVKKYIFLACLRECQLIQAICRRADADIKSRELGVLFEDLRVVGLGASASFQSTFGSLFNPFGIVGAIRSMRHPPLRNILSGFEGVVRPGEMLRKCQVTL